MICLGRGNELLDFLILYEHKVRELDNICLIRAELEKRSYSVEFFQIDELKRWKYFFYKKPKVILGTALGNNQRINDYIYSTVGSIKKIVNLQLEQVITPKWEKTKVFIPTGDGSKITHICWGEESYQRLIRQGAKNPVICGAIQTDFFREEFNDYYMSRREVFKRFNLNINKKTVIYISSFSPTTMSDEEYKYLEFMGGESLKDLRDFFMKSKITTLEWIKEYLKENNETIFIYRPHPNEKQDEKLIKMEHEFSNFRVIGDLSVKQWIIVVDKIYTWISTSIIEAYYASKKCAIVRPYKVQKLLDIPFYNNSIQINNLDEFIKSNKIEEIEFPINKEEIQTRYDYLNQKPSFIRICDLLEDVYKNKNYDIKPSINKKTLIKNYFRSIIQDFIARHNLLEPSKTNNMPSKTIKKYLLKLNSTGKKYNNTEFLSKEETDITIEKCRQIVMRYDKKFRK